VAAGLGLIACRTPSRPRSASTHPRLHLIAPSGWLADPERYQRGLGRLERAGFQLEFPERGSRRASRFAGTEEQRLADLNGLSDPGAPMPDLVMLTRGGYGAIHLLAGIDYDRLCARMREAGTVLVGYSDFTALGMALLAKGGVVTWSGPMVYTDLGAAEPNPDMLASFRQAITSPVVTLRVDRPQVDTGTFEGTFWGGNLTTLAALAGSPYLPDIQGGLLYLEDDGEPLYRFDRLLFQLHHTGLLARQKALVIGAFTRMPQDSYDPDYTLERVLANLRRRLGIPIFTGFPGGHIPDLRTFPVGGQGRIEAGPAGFTLTLTGHPWLRNPPAAFRGGDWAHP
jgi:muramoyltetrapeptide carboxypeptidase